MSSVIRGEDKFETSAGGIVLQTRYAVFKQPKKITVTQMTVTEIDELTVRITPKSARSVFKLEFVMPHESDGPNPENTMFSCTRNGTFIQPDNINSRNGGISARTINFPAPNASSMLDFGSFVFVDEPATAGVITYKAAVRTAKTLEMYINRTVTDTDDVAFERGMSTFIVTELSGT